MKRKRNEQRIRAISTILFVLIPLTLIIFTGILWFDNKKLLIAEVVMTVIIGGIMCIPVVFYSVLDCIKNIVENIDDSFAHIPYTLEHRKKLIELSEIYLGKRKYWFHDLDKVVMYILIPWVGTGIINKIHTTLSPHHVSYFRGISKVDKKQAILDWESARFTKPDKPMNAAETLVSKYPQYLEDFSGYFYLLGLNEELEKVLWPTNS